MTEKSSIVDFRYRADVDGLRGIAVMLVILFHGGIFFSGGFIGVDVFFVISGYLITAQIVKHHDAGTLNLKHFWIRRAKRILPASIVVTAIVLAAGYFLLFAGDFESLGKATLAQQFMVANIFFWRTTDYFASAAETKPLLHMWSLAVEEQFYLLYPFLLAHFLKSRARRHSLAIFIGFSLLFLVASETAVRVRPVAAFYLLPSRVWELLVGGLVVFLPAIPDKWYWRREVVATVAVLMILVPAIVFDSATVFPGLHAICPVLGASLLIWAGSMQLSFASKLIASTPMRFVGLISYSLYLWHWPLFAYSHYWLGETLSAVAVSTVLLGSFILACITWRYVETPFRRLVSPPQQARALISFLVVTVAICIGSLFVISTNGLPTRLPSSIARYEKAEQDRACLNKVETADVQNGRLPVFGSPEGTRSCLIWGDSHAMVLIPGIDWACKEIRIKGYQATHPITAPLLDFSYTASPSGLGKLAPEFNQSVYEFAVQEKVDVAILAGRWSVYVDVPNFESQLRATIDRLISSNIKVAVVLDVASDSRLSPRTLARRAFWGLDDDSGESLLAKHRASNRQCDEIIRRAAFGKASILDPATEFVNGDGIWQAEIDNEIMYFDDNHLSTAGGIRLSAAFLRLFNDIFADIQHAESGPR